MTLTDLIEEAERDEDRGIRKRLRITTTRGFYAHYDIELPKRMYHTPNTRLPK